MKAKVEWVGNFTFIGSSDSNRYTLIDHSEDREMKKGPSPTELFLQALCSCTAIDVVSILKKMKEPIKGLQVSAEGIRSKEFPQVFTDISLEYSVDGEVKEDSLDKAISLSQEKYCHISISLKRAGAKVNVTRKINRG